MPEERPEPARTPGRVEWLELFFDLVVVAAVAVLSETLREDATAPELGLFLISYGAVWFAWVSVVMYADVAGELTRVRTVIVSMFLLAVMAAAAPGHFEARADAFAGAFVLVRVFAARDSLRTGRLMTAWPLLQAGGFTVPWLVSLVVPTPWKYWLWALGLVLDLAIVLTRGERLVGDQRERLERSLGRDEQSSRRRRGDGQRHDPVALTEVDVDREHLEERLGLFVIIVLGESVAALVLTAAQTPWTRDFVGTAVAGFLLLVLLWLLTFSYGFTSAPGVRLGAMPPRFGLPLHLASTLGILLIGVGLGEAVTVQEPLHDLMLWVIVGGVALHSAASLVSGLLGHAPRFWVRTCALPAVAFPLLLGVLGLGLDHRPPTTAPGLAAHPARAVAVPPCTAHRRSSRPAPPRDRHDLRCARMRACSPTRTSHAWSRRSVARSSRASPGRWTTSSGAPPSSNTSAACGSAWPPRLRSCSSPGSSTWRSPSPARTASATGTLLWVGFDTFELLLLALTLWLSWQRRVIGLLVGFAHRRGPAVRRLVRPAHLGPRRALEVVVAAVARRDPPGADPDVGRGPRAARRVRAAVVLRPRRTQLGDPAALADPSEPAGRRRLTGRDRTGPGPPT